MRPDAVRTPSPPDSPPIAPSAAVTHAARRRAVSYARTAAGGPLGIAAQHAANRAAAARDGYALLDDVRAYYADEDRGGAPRARRPGLAALRADVRAGRAAFTRVYVRDPARFGRWNDLRTRFRVEAWFERRGVAVHYSA